MKRIPILILASILLLSSCSFDTEKDSVIDIMTLKGDYDINYYHDVYYSAHGDADRNTGNQGGEVVYNAVSRKSDVTEISAFTADDIEIYTAVPDAYESNIDGNNIRNRLKKKQLFDLNGQDVEMTPILSDIMERIAEFENDMLLTQIFKDQDAYFVYVELNVNWWSPCELYYYQQDTGQLENICSLDGERITGLHIRDHEYFHTKNEPSEASEGQLFICCIIPLY